MKKIASIFAFFAFFSFSLLAQDFSKFRFGVNASPTWSSLRTNDKKLDGVSTNWGLKFGLQGEYYFAPNYALISGIGFGLNQGGTIQNGYPLGVFWPKSDLSDPKFDTLPINAKLHYRVNYVEIPIGFRLRGGSNEDARIKYYAELPVFTIGIVSKAVGDIRGTNGQDTEDENIREDVNGLSLSWGFGGGIEYELASNTTLVAGLAYQRQFTDLTNDAGYVLKAANQPLEKENSKGSFGLLSLRLGIFF